MTGSVPGSIAPPQRVVAGRYELEKLLGAGGMAEVYLAHDRRLERPVAIKLLGPGFASDPDLIERFKREAQAAAGLNHPNVVAIYDWGQDGSAHYLVMEYVAGQNLKELVRRDGPLPEGRALGIAADIAAALEAAHTRGVVHRDVKPHNVMLDGRGRVKVADFGIAQAGGATTLTRTGAGVLGSAHYMSPEQTRGERVDARSDLYSLGVLLLELLTGRPPYQGDAPLIVAMQHVNAPVPSVHETRADISPATAALLTRAMAKDPTDRFPSAAAMRVALDAAHANPGHAPIIVATSAEWAGPRAETSSPTAWAQPRIKRSILPDRWPLLAALALVLLLALAALRARAATALPGTAIPPPTQSAVSLAIVSPVSATAVPTPTPGPTAEIPTAVAPPPTIAPAPPPAPARTSPGRSKKKD